MVMPTLHLTCIGCPSKPRTSLRELSYIEAMPAMAPAALLKIVLNRPFIPAISTTEYIIVMSVSPTICPVSPEATVLTSSLGTPIGMVALMTSETTLVPPLPPALRTPWTSPCCTKSATHFLVWSTSIRRAGPRDEKDSNSPGCGACFFIRLGIEIVIASCETSVLPQSIKVIRKGFE